MKDKKFLMQLGTLVLLEVVGTVTALCMSVSANEVEIESKSDVSCLSAESVVLVGGNLVKGNRKVVDFFEVEPTIEDYRVVEIPDREYDFKSYMDYHTLGKYEQNELQNIASTDEDGFRVIDDRYIVAVGTAVCEEVGTYITLVLENGTEIEAVVGDIKDNKHTDDSNIVTVANGCCSEFIVDSGVMEDRILRSGNISNYREDWQSKVVQILVYRENIFEE